VPAVVERLEWTAEACNRTSPTMLNPAKQLALHLLGKQVWIYGGEGLPEIAAYRWKCQLNECAEAVASWHCFPELTHNEIAGWQVDTGSPASRALLVLRDERERPEFARRIDTTVELVERRFAFVEQVTTRGSSPLLRLLDLCYLGDFVSTYLGIAGGIDPNAIELIDRLKDAAARQRAEPLPSTAPSSRGLVLGP
jgi:glucose/mannose-6-phosphate isomerase